MNTSIASLLLCWTLGMSGCAVGLGLIDVGSTRTVSYQGITSGEKIGETYDGEIYEYTIGTKSMKGGGFGMLTGVHVGHHLSSFGDESESGWIMDTFYETVLSSGWWGFGLRFDYMLRFGDRG